MPGLGPNRFSLSRWRARATSRRAEKMKKKLSRDGIVSFRKNDCSMNQKQVREVRKQWGDGERQGRIDEEKTAKEAYMAMIETARQAVWSLQAVCKLGTTVNPPLPLSTWLVSESPLPNGVFTCPEQEPAPSLLAVAM